MVLTAFEQKIKNNLIQNDIDLSECKFGVAVSGGADSVSLLIALCNILKDYNHPLKVITVNHNIREEKETSGDVEFVLNLCSLLKSQGYNLEAFDFEIPRGKILEKAQCEKSGIEDAARKMRYSLFEDFINNNELDYLCLAHNQNDQMETVLMRFLQGASIDSLTGIAFKRDVYLRPLLNVTRKEIEDYLLDKKISWRTDSTNQDTAYLRNKIRLKLIPFLNEEFSGWQTALLNGIKKAQRDSEIICKAADDIEINLHNNCTEIDRNDFEILSDSLKIRSILKAINLLGYEKRIPYQFLEDIISINKNTNCEKYFDDLEISLKKEKIYFKKRENSETDFNFSDIIEENKSYSLPFGKLDAVYEDEGLSSLYFNGTFTGIKTKLPVMVRNYWKDDKIKTADGKMKKIADIYKDWHVPEDKRNYILVFQELVTKEQNIICILGDFLGFKNWIV